MKVLLGNDHNNNSISCKRMMSCNEQFSTARQNCVIICVPDMLIEAGIVFFFCLCASACFSVCPHKNRKLLIRSWCEFRRIHFMVWTQKWLNVDSSWLWIVSVRAIFVQLINYQSDLDAVLRDDSWFCVPDVTYNVFDGTLNRTQPTNHLGSMRQIKVCTFHHWYVSMSILSVECCDSLTKLLCIEVGHVSSQFTRCLSAAAVRPAFSALMDVYICRLK